MYTLRQKCLNTFWCHVKTLPIAYCIQGCKNIFHGVNNVAQFYNVPILRAFHEAVVLVVMGVRGVQSSWNT